MDVPDLAEILEKIPTPSMWNTLPIQLPKWIYASIVGIPSAIRSIHRILEERKQRKKLEEEEALLVFSSMLWLLALFHLWQLKQFFFCAHLNIIYVKFSHYIYVAFFDNEHKKKVILIQSMRKVTLNYYKCQLVVRNWYSIIFPIKLLHIIFFSYWIHFTSWAVNHTSRNTQ